MIRLYVDTPLCQESTLSLTKEQAHYLFQVMRCKPGDEVAVFNGKDGEWQASIADISKKQALLINKKQLKKQQAEPDIVLCFALVKNTPLTNIIQKATELGVRAFQPMVTERTNQKTINHERLHRICIESAEQCERLTVPEIYPVQSLDKLLAGWQKERLLVLCDESGKAPPAMEALAQVEANTSLGILIGPEGGFAESEFAILRKAPYVVSMSMGPRILRADTAAIAALTCCQSKVGDWYARPSFKYDES